MCFLYIYISRPCRSGAWSLPAAASSPVPASMRVRAARCRFEPCLPPLSPVPPCPRAAPACRCSWPWCQQPKPSQIAFMTARLPACLPACPPTYLPARRLPACPPACLPAYLPVACLPGVLHSSASGPALPACSHPPGLPPSLARRLTTLQACLPPSPSGAHVLAMLVVALRRQGTPRIPPK